MLVMLNKLKRVSQNTVGIFSQFSTGSSSNYLFNRSQHQFLYESNQQKVKEISHANSKGYNLIFQSKPSAKKKIIQSLSILRHATDLNALNVFQNSIIEQICQQLKNLSPEEELEVFSLVSYSLKSLAVADKFEEKQYIMLISEPMRKILECLPKVRKFYEEYQCPHQLTFEEANVVLAGLPIIIQKQSKGKSNEHLENINLIFMNLAPHFKSMNFNTIMIFMTEVRIGKWTPPFEMLDILLDTVQTENFEDNYRYGFLLFSKYCLDEINFVPLFFLFPNVKKIPGIDSQLSLKQIYTLVKFLAIETQLVNRIAYKILPSIYNKQISFLSRIIQAKKYPTIVIICIYNLLSSNYPLGLSLFNEIIQGNERLHLQQSDADFPFVKQYVTRMMSNLQPSYIFSIEQRTFNEMNLMALDYIKQLALAIVKVEPKFVLKFACFFHSNFDYSIQFEEKVQSVLKELSQQVDFSLRNNKEEVRSIVNLLNEMNQGGTPYPISSLIEEIIGGETLEQLADWKCLYEALAILKRGQNIDNIFSLRIKQVFQNICAPYITKAVASKSHNASIIRACNHQEGYILRIIALMGSTFHNDYAAFVPVLVQFINNNFIYTVKSVAKYGIFEIEGLLNQLPGISPQIYAYLYNNLSSFIMYTVNGGFYLKRGSFRKNDEIFVALLKSAMKKSELLIGIKNKERLSMLKILAESYWPYLNNKDIAHFLLIFNSPTLIGDKLKSKLKEVTFIRSDFNNIDIRALSVYRLHNASLMKLLKQEFPNEMQSKVEDLMLLKEKPADQIKKLFQNLQFYEEVLENRSFDQQELIPEPATSNQKVKMIYICLKIIGKIRKFRDFYGTSSPQLIKQSIDLTEEIRYIQREGLIKIDDKNQFKLNNVEVSGNNQMIEGWSFYKPEDNLYRVKEFHDLFNASENIYEKVLMAVCGNSGVIKDLLKRETFYSQVLVACLQFNLAVTPKGSLIEIGVKEKHGQNNFKSAYIICSQNKNYKIHSIFAYILEKNGYHVCQIDEKTKKGEIIDFVRSEFRELELKKDDAIEAEALDAVESEQKQEKVVS